ncbi:MAG TPA: cysteine desulfurase-like protein [Thermoanaerobaculia bacterium]|nr:cysteine desulfurase-like protein [Thermoanaerobaculia bacterium]
MTTTDEHSTASRDPQASTSPALDVDGLRRSFPALATGEVYLDNPGGTQVPEPVITAICAYLRDHNANLGGAFRTSTDSDSILAEARAAHADLLAARPEEIAFGPNMTTATFALSRALGREWGPGDELVVTQLDHDANVTPWRIIARDRGMTVRTIELDPSDCTLRLDQLDELLSERTRLVAVGWASNAVGTVNPVCEVAQRAKAVGALTFVDAVQYAPHAAIDVAEAGCDLLAVSSYKVFGPHVGILWGREDLLDRLRVYKVRPSKNRSPEKLETGTQNHEGIAGAGAAVDYLASLSSLAPEAPRRERLVDAWRRIRAHEEALCRRLLDGLSAIRGLRIYGITDPARLAERVPTVSFTLDGLRPREIAKRLAARGIFVWDGDYYAVDVVDALGLRATGGMVRVGLAHYNTAAEVDRLITALDEISVGAR